MAPSRQPQQQRGPQNRIQSGNTIQAPKPAAAPSDFETLLEKPVKFTPLGEGEEITLTGNIVLNHLCTPTKNGHYPPASEVMKFIMICRQRGLNPWAGDAWLLGYDTNDGPKWSIIVAIQALFKRAEINANFRGIESGVIVRDKQTKELIERAGDFFIREEEEILGGWAAVYRADREKPFYQRLSLSTYSRDTQIWRKDPGGMICKDAEAAALRQAFPSDVGGLYLQSEMMELEAAAGVAAPPKVAEKADARQQIKARLDPNHVPAAAPAAAPQAPPQYGPPAQGNDDVPFDESEAPSRVEEESGYQEESGGKAATTGSTTARTAAAPQPERRPGSDELPFGAAADSRF